MRILHRRGVAAVVSVGLAFLGLGNMASAGTVPSGMHGTMTKSVSRSTRRARIAAAASAAAASAGAQVDAISENFRLKLKNLHTGESLDIVYRVGDEYLPEAVEEAELLPARSAYAGCRRV